MNNINPATPAPAAAPGNAPQNSNQLPVATSPATPNNEGQGNNQEGNVSISLKEYRNLQRDKARVLSFDKRAQFLAKKNSAAQMPDSGYGDDPELVSKLAEATTAQQEAERRALQAEVRNQVRDLLEKEEFKSLPKSTKDLILKNPAMLTEADSLEEAILDIEDWVREKVILNESQTPSQQTGVKPSEQQPRGHEAPPVINSGAPAPADASGLEDLSKLSGPARSQAAIRNKIKMARGVKQV